MKKFELQKFLPIATVTGRQKNRKDRIKALGNSIVPQVAAIPLELIKIKAATNENRN